MFREDTLQNSGKSGMPKKQSLSDQEADLASLREAYLAAVGDSGRVVSGKMLNQSQGNTRRTDINARPATIKANPIKSNANITSTQTQNTINPVTGHLAFKEFSEAMGQIQEPQRNVKVPTFLITDEPDRVKQSQWDKPLGASIDDFMNTATWSDSSTDLLPNEAMNPDGELNWNSQFHRYDSVWVKLFEKPRLLLGILGLGLVSCSVYIALGYWWLGSAPPSQAAEPVNLLNLETKTPLENQDSTSRFNNIHNIQQNPATGGSSSSPPLKPVMEKTDQDLLAQTLPSSQPNLQLDSSAKEAGALGRPDPFSPLVIDTKTPGGGTISDDTKKDLLADVMYTGFIGDSNSKNKVALIRVFDTISGMAKTQIKKVGESININGQDAVVKSISKTSVKLNAAGELRELTIQPYQTGTPQPLGGTNNSTTSNFNTDGNYSADGSYGNANPAQPVLREPSSR